MEDLLLQWVSLKQIAANKISLTGAYLSGRRAIASAKKGT